MWPVHSLSAYLRKVSRRLAIIRALRIASVAVLGLTLLVLIILATTYLGLPVASESLLQMYLMMLPVILLASLIISLLRAPALFLAARHIDQRFKLHELVETAATASPTSPFTEVVRSLAESHIHTLPPHQVAPIGFMRLHSASLVAVMVFSLLSLSLPKPVQTMHSAALINTTTTQYSEASTPAPVYPSVALPHMAAQVASKSVQPTQEIPVEAAVTSHAGSHASSSSGYAHPSASPAPGQAESPLLATQLNTSLPIPPTASVHQPGLTRLNLNTTTGAAASASLSQEEGVAPSNLPSKSASGGTIPALSDFPLQSHALLRLYFAREAR